MSTIEAPPWDVIVLSHECILPDAAPFGVKTVIRCSDCGQHWERRENETIIGPEHYWKPISERRVNRLKKGRIRTVGYRYID